MTTILLPREAFGTERDHGACCACCDDLTACPGDQPEDRVLRRFRSLNDHAYLTDNRVAFLEDRVLELPKSWQVIDTNAVEPKVALYVPTTRPSTPTRWPTASTLDRLDRLGVEIRSDNTGDTEQLLHLYLDVDHIGWAMSARFNPCDPADLPLIRRLMELGLSPDKAHRALIQIRDGVTT
jgi:hypothetical protein